MSIKEIKTSDFESEVLKSDLPVVVDFFTPQCGPCRSLAPIYAQFAEKHSEAKFVKLDVSEDASLVSEYGVRGVPTVIAFKGGKEHGRIVGNQGEPGLTKLLKTLGVE